METELSELKIPCGVSVRENIRVKNHSSVKPALLTRNVLDWLQGNITLSNNYERKIKSDIRRKIKLYQEVELPLLVKCGFVSQTAATANCNVATADCNIGKDDISTFQLNHVNHAQIYDKIVGRKGFEPSTPAMSRRYLNQARPPVRKFRVFDLEMA
jgi:hypothetical protein